MPPPAVTLPLWYILPPLTIIAGWLLTFTPLWIAQTRRNARQRLASRQADVAARYTAASPQAASMSPCDTGYDYDHP